MKIKRWHVAVLALFVLLCGALFYHFYTERISNEALQAVDFQALRAHTAELLENGFRANDQLFSSDYYDVRPDSTCYIWLNGSENDALYTSCCNATKGIYYYTTYENHQITAVDMHRENLDGETLVHYPVVKGEHILWQN